MRSSLVLPLLLFAAAAPASAQFAGPGVPSISPGVPSYNPGVPSYRPGVPAQSPGIVLGRPGGAPRFQPYPPRRYYPPRHRYPPGPVLYIAPDYPY